jgi:hypothetical protein
VKNTDRKSHDHKINDRIRRFHKDCEQGVVETLSFLKRKPGFLHWYTLEYEGYSGSHSPHDVDHRNDLDANCKGSMGGEDAVVETQDTEFRCCDTAWDQEGANP